LLARCFVRRSDGPLCELKIVLYNYYYRLDVVVAGEKKKPNVYTTTDKQEEKYIQEILEGFFSQRPVASRSTYIILHRTAYLSL